MGTGCARGFLAAFDTVWATRQWALKRADMYPTGKIELWIADSACSNALVKPDKGSQNASLFVYDKLRFYFISALSGVITFTHLTIELQQLFIYE